MYGTHYSAPAFAAYYLVREHPEWTLHLHGGKFDEADRSFFSLGETWAGVLRSTADVKEPSRTLTPLLSPSRTLTPLLSPPLPSPPLPSLGRSSSHSSTRRSYTRPLPSPS